MENNLDLLNMSLLISSTVSIYDFIIRLVSTICVFYILALQAKLEKKASMSMIILFFALTLLSFIYGIFIKPIPISIFFSYCIFLIYILMRYDKPIIRKGEFSFLFLSIMTSVINSINTEFINYSEIIIIDFIIIASILINNGIQKSLIIGLKNAFTEIDT